jgi:xylulokinase
VAIDKFPYNMASPLYIGFDLSTQQLKGLVVSSDLKVEYEAKFDFDAHSHGFDIKKGVLTNEAEHEVFAPVALWLQALDWVLNTLKEQGLDFKRVKGISGAGQQHGSVYWSVDAETLLKGLDKGKKLEEQLGKAFSHPFSPNWQDASTQRECDEFDAYLGGPEELAEVTGSKAHHVSFFLSCCVEEEANCFRSDSQDLRSYVSSANTRSSIRKHPGFHLCRLF